MKHTLADQVPVVITLDDGTTVVMSFLLRGSSPTLPYGAVWEDGIGATGVWLRPASDANIFAELTKALPSVNRLGEPKPQPVRYAVVKWEDIPSDRTYRNALRHTNNTFDHDLEKAKAIHLDHIRHVRATQFAELDNAWMRALGQGDLDQAAAVEARRQVLRDAPAIDLSGINAIDTLKLTWPAALPPWEG